MHWTSVVSIVLATAIYGSVVSPALVRYRAWKADPQRIPVARPNWRGVYVPDLTLIRLKRLLVFGYISTPVLGILSLIFIIPHAQG